MQFLGLIPDKETATARTLKICQCLYEDEIDFTELKLTKTIKGKSIFITLNDIPGIDIEQIKSKVKGISGDTKIGKMITSLRQAYNKTNRMPMSEKEREQADAIPRTYTR